MPVYKEGLKGVIIPTVTSVIAAIKHYEQQGGTANIFVNDDGMQLVQEDQAAARKAFFRDETFARGETKDDPKYFERKGQFKKASNMNYCLDFSLRVEEEFQKRLESYCLQRGVNQQDLSIEEENEIYDQARNAVVEQDNGKTKAAGNCRIGEIILIIDSDTRVV